MTISSQSELDGMRRVGRLVALAVKEMKAAVQPGMTTEELDEVGAHFLAGHGARSAPQLDYQFPGFNCISVNEQIVHGVPSARALRPGDVVKIDVTAELDGFIADSAITVVLPPKAPHAVALVRCAHQAFDRALAVARAGEAVSSLGRAVEQEVKRHGFSVIRTLSGHGVGRRIHESPEVPNFYSPLTRGRLNAGMVIAVEPLISIERADVVEERDGWTLRTHNRSLAAHYEHTILIRDGSAEILTAA
jgi:methionyl aminopeptidase